MLIFLFRNVRLLLICSYGKITQMIRLLVLDVDGTMTDGGVYYDATGNELKKFAIKDGAGLVLDRKSVV